MLVVIITIGTIKKKEKRLKNKKSEISIIKCEGKVSVVFVELVIVV